MTRGSSVSNFSLFCVVLVYLFVVLLVFDSVRYGSRLFVSNFSLFCVVLACSFAVLFVFGSLRYGSRLFVSNFSLFCVVLAYLFAVLFVFGSLRSFCLVVLTCFVLCFACFGSLCPFFFDALFALEFGSWFEPFLKKRLSTQFFWFW